MKRAILVSAFVLCLSTACKKETYPPGTPECIKQTIESNKNNSNWSIGSVEEYEFQGKLVYAFSPDNRIDDASTEIYTSDCQNLCALGGLVGITLCNGDKFFQKAILKRTIWKR